MNATRFSTAALVLAGLAATGVAGDAIIAPAWTRFRAGEPALRRDAARAAAGHGVMLAVLGGFRALAADLAWVRLYTVWETRDLAAADTLVRLVPAIDPRPVYFWLNGARIVAHDFAAWRIAAAGGYDALPPARRERIEREQAEQAIALLAAARAIHPGSADLWIEQANIELNECHDPAAAAESYRRAWESPNGPYYAARLYAEMLRRVGRRAEALAWLIKLYPSLPAND